MRLKAENALASDDENRLKSALRAILDQVGRLDALLRDLLAMTQRHQPKPVEVDLRALLDRAVEAHAELAASKGIKVGIATGDHSSISARLDVDQIRRVLDNLILNAIQNTPAQGSINLSATHENHRLYLRVVDTGSGVPAAIADRLFEPFVTGRADGTGLGLAIVREIARAHGGAARLIPSADGAIFELELPWQPS
jgi:signal transduction histidine kinase